MDLDDFEMQHAEFKTSELWTSKFAELRQILDGNCLDKSAVILKCWTSLPERFSCLKKVALALLPAFGSTYACKQIFLT